MGSLQYPQSNTYSSTLYNISFYLPGYLFTLIIELCIMLSGKTQLLCEFCRMSVYPMKSWDLVLIKDDPTPTRQTCNFILYIFFLLNKYRHINKKKITPSD